MSAGKTTLRRKQLVRPIAQVDPSDARNVARLEERGATRYPSLASLSMEALSALLDDALRTVRRPAMAGAVGLAVLAGGCQESHDAAGATLAPLGEVQDMPSQDAPTDLTLPSSGGWGSLGTGTVVPTTPNEAPPTGGTGSDPTEPCDEPCDAVPSTDLDGGAPDGGVDAGRRRHLIPNHHIRPAGIARRIVAVSSKGTP